MSNATDNPSAPASVPVDETAIIISDAEIARVHGHANFGPGMSPRDVVNEGVLKYAIGYHSGHTQLSILLEHGLITKPRPGSYDASLTKKGKRYARALHSAGKTLRTLARRAAWREPEGETAPQGVTFDLIQHLHRQREFSERTFGPGARTAGVIDHIRKELREIEAAPDDIGEWIDVVLLALDGAWRSGASPEAIAAALLMKQTRNEGRTWPDWRTADPTKAIEHDRSDEAADTAEMPEVAQARYIELLRADEGDCITICCNDPEAFDATQSVAIDCNGAWTDWNDRRFYGESILQCLALAVSARESAQKEGGQA